MEEKFIMISMDDEKATKVAEVLSNKTCKKILNLLADQKEVSQTDISQKIKLPISTVEYNIKKLVEAGLIERTTNFFWSVKGKKIPMYKVSNKSIIISPRNSNIASKLKSILPVALISGAGAMAIKLYISGKEATQVAFSKSADMATNEILYESARAPNQIIQSTPSVVPYFMAGVLLTLIIFSIWNWRKL